MGIRWLYLQLSPQIWSLTSWQFFFLPTAAVTFQGQQSISATRAGCKSGLRSYHQCSSQWQLALGVASSQDQQFSGFHELSHFDRQQASSSQQEGKKYLTISLNELTLWLYRIWTWNDFNPGVTAWLIHAKILILQDCWLLNEPTWLPQYIYKFTFIMVFSFLYRRGTAVN